VPAFLYLVDRSCRPRHVLFGLATSLLPVVFPLVMIKGGLRLVSGEDAKRPIAVARDAATGESIVPSLPHTEHDKTKTYRYGLKMARLSKGPLIR